jgi:hypothetical protein
MATFDTKTYKDNVALGATSAILAFASLAVMSALVKEASQGTSVEVVVFFQNLVCLIVVAPVVIIYGWGEIKTARVGILSMCCARSPAPAPGSGCSSPSR